MFVWIVTEVAHSEGPWAMSWATLLSSPRVQGSVILPGPVPRDAIEGK